jgi:hypothetical protein
VFRTEEIDQMVAPIALCLNQLLAQVLMAATDPLEIVMAERWLEDPGNANPPGDQLAAALGQQTWDPSFKSLKDLGPHTAELAEKMSLFNLDSIWKLTEPMACNSRMEERIMKRHLAGLALATALLCLGIVGLRAQQ